MGKLLTLLWALVGAVSLASAGSAAQIVIDVSGRGYESLTFNATTTNDPFGASSSVTLETDRNGDGTVGDIALVTATLNITHPIVLPVGTLTIDEVLTLQGGTGTMTGSQILWDPTPVTALT